MSCARSPPWPSLNPTFPVHSSQGCRSHLGSGSSEWRAPVKMGSPPSGHHPICPPATPHGPLEAGRQDKTQTSNRRNCMALCSWRFSTSSLYFSALFMGFSLPRDSNQNLQVADAEVSGGVNVTGRVP